MKEIIMPKIYDDMQKGIIERWYKSEGDFVKKGDILFEVATEKVSVEVESFFEGYLKKIIRKEGEEVPVEEAIGYIGDKNEK